MSQEDRRNIPSEGQNRDLAYRQNPSTISPEVVSTLAQEMDGKPPEELAQHFRTRVRDSSYGLGFRDTFLLEFHMLRVGWFDVSTTVPTTSSDGQSVSVLISSFDEDEILPKDLPDTENPFLDWFTGVNIMKGVVSSAFHAEAVKRGVTIEVNHDYVATPPVKKDQFGEVSAPVPGLFIYEWEEAEIGLKQTGTEFFDFILHVSETLSFDFASKFVKAYASLNLPDEEVAKVSSSIREQYNDIFMGWAIRTYAMFTPTPPKLHEVTNIVTNSRDTI